MKKIFLLFSAISFVTFAVNAQLVVTPDTNTIQLVNNFVLSGVTTANVEYTGALNTLGSFSNGNTTNIGLSDGIIMTTGNLTSTPIGSPASVFASTDNGSAGCAILDNLVSGTTYNASILEFDLVPAGNVLEFQYVFASEEYPEYVCSSYNDVFGFFITGPDPSGGSFSDNNIAIVPGSTFPVAINSINNGTSGSYGSSGSCYSLNNSSLYVDNEELGGQSIVFDGFTTVLLAQLYVVPGQSYHLKMAIADVSDAIYDSGIFLKAQSMKSYNSTTGIDKVQSDLYNVYTNSANDHLIINRKNNNNKNEILSIYNTQGQIMMQTPLQEDKTEIGISNLSKGVYIVKINDTAHPFITKIVK